jgi:hypothetical protein
MNCEVPDEFPDLRKLVEEYADEEYREQIWRDLKLAAQRIWADGWAEGYASA